MNHRREAGRPGGPGPRPGQNPPRQDPAVYGESRAAVLQVEKLRDVDADVLVRHADKIGEDLKAKVKHAQLRHMLDEVNRIRLDRRKASDKSEETLLTRIKLLKPRFAYLAGRETNLRPLYNVLSAMIDRTKGAEDFDRLAEFVQAVVAYHKFHGGSDR